jgi:hypothetical protein
LLADVQHEFEQIFPVLGCASSSTSSAARGGSVISCAAGFVQRDGKPMPVQPRELYLDSL